MKVLIQRVTQAQVDIAGACVGKIDSGLLLLVGLEKHDNQQTLERMCHKVLNYRIFADDEGKMNLSVKDINGGVLAVSQFTLAAQTHKGLRPGFSSAALPHIAKNQYQEFVALLRQDASNVQTGEFGADMQVSLVNDGPVTFMLEL
ncbi:D-aminoacyl-tRNA deacylase [Marinagarivorans cellulosilyticus]|uniref:D-aminoacyl-tRNA deacylase n=1 Tax=Marinagarivorans cellulosilyticus TaxID=2721545 RepID=A0AAN2BIR8_9GAMM|nr:D-aminoacyl-tRNA deacylase [Marinagarivorans cellulosilyticus]BCD96169.1 D-aminoacyl-tRNA deacylase [Marinagarivorans cellulosilyticus]